MGLFNFLKSAGRKEQEEQEAAVIEKNQELIKANKLKRYVLSLGLGVENLKIAFDDSVATVSGTAESQSVREKVVLAIGNTEGVGQVDDQMDVATEEAEARFHTVVRGDSLSAIAKTYYGDAMKYPAIFEANKPMLTDPNLIYPGQVLRLPVEV